ncbi:MAG: hypothetical protein ABIK73_08735 [candidate division WOR-3 bacterium]
MKNSLKTLKISLLLLVFGTFSFLQQNIFIKAADTEQDQGGGGNPTPTYDYKSRCQELESLTWSGAPSPLAILCPVARITNILILSSAAVFVIIILISSIKYSLAQGDIKALQASKMTLTWGVLGFFAVIGVFAILTIIQNLFDLSNNPIIDPIGFLNSALKSLFDELDIKNY